MAVIASRVDVGIAPTLIATGEGGAAHLIVQNRGANAMYLGGAAVAVGTGFQLDKTEAVSFTIQAGHSLYGIVAAATEAAHVLKDQV